MKESTGFLAELDAAVRNFEDRGDLASYNSLLEIFFTGIRENAMIEIPFDIDLEKIDGAPAAIEYDDGSVTLVILTDMDEETAACAVPFKLRSLVKEMDRRENCDGIIFNPGRDSLFISRTLIKSAISAGYRVAADEIEEEAAVMAQNRTEKEIAAKRPMSEDQFAAIEGSIRAFYTKRDDFLKVSFRHDEDLLFFQVFRTGQPGERHLSFGFDMDDFGWDEPLVLGGALPLEKTMEILRKVCVDGIAPEPDKIKELEHFRKMG